MNALIGLWRDEAGTAAIEYALIGTLVSLAGIKSLHCITAYCIAPLFNYLAGVF